MVKCDGRDLSGEGISEVRPNSQMRLTQAVIVVSQNRLLERYDDRQVECCLLERDGASYGEQETEEIAPLLLQLSREAGKTWTYWECSLLQDVSDKRHTLTLDFTNQCMSYF